MRMMSRIAPRRRASAIGSTPASSLRARVQAVEHRLLPQVVRELIS